MFHSNKYGSFVRKKRIKYVGKNPKIADIKIASNSRNFMS